MGRQQSVQRGADMPLARADPHCRTDLLRHIGLPLLPQMATMGHATLSEKDEEPLPHLVHPLRMLERYRHPWHHRLHDRSYFLKGKPLSRIPLYFQEKGILSLFWDVNVWAEDRTNLLGMLTPMTGPIDLPLWFLRDLIVVTVLTPFVYGFVKHTRHYGILLLALAYISGVWPNLSGFNITAVFFFSTGAYFSIHGKNLVMECQCVRMASYIAAIAFLLPSIWLDGRNTPVGYILYPFYIISGVCAAFNLAADLLRKGKTKVHPLLAQSTFFIYALHTIVVLAACNFLVQHLLSGEHPLIQTIAYLLTPLLCVSACLGIFLFLKRFMPKILGILTGNRY